MTEPTEPHASAVAAMLAVQGEILAIGKGSYNRDQGFWFRGIEAVMAEVGPLLRKHGVLLTPRGLSLQSERYVTKSGAHMRNVTVEIEYTARIANGDTFVGSAYGEAADAGDKATSKAQSVALRVFLTQGLSIPTDLPDPDATSHERSGVTPVEHIAKAALAAQAARDDLSSLITLIDVSRDEAMERFAADNDGLSILDCHNPKPIRALEQRYREEFADQLAAAQTATANA